MKRGSKRSLLGLGVGFLGMLVPVGVSLVVTLLTQPSGDVLALFWENKFKLLPIALGFGVQVGLYGVLRRGMHWRIFVPAGRATTATGGGLSTAAMIACCAPTGVNLLLPLLGATAATSFLANLTMPFMVAGTIVNGLGIAVMLFALVRERQARQRTQACQQPSLS